MQKVRLCANRAESEHRFECRTHYKPCAVNAVLAAQDDERVHRVMNVFSGVKIIQILNALGHVSLSERIEGRGDGWLQLGKKRHRDTFGMGWG